MNETIKLTVENESYTIESSKYIPFDNKTEKQNEFLKTDDFKKFKNTVKNWNNIYASFEYNKKNGNVSADIDNILFYNLGIDGNFQTIVMELKNNNDTKCIYRYVKNKNEFDIYKNDIHNKNNKISFSYEIPINVNSALEVWYYARTEFINHAISNDFFNGSKYAIIINAKHPKKQFFPYNNGLSIKKILDGTMLAMSYSENTKKDEIVEQLDKNENIENLIKEKKGFNINNLFIKKRTLQTNPPDDKIYALKFENKICNTENCNTEKYIISVDFFKLDQTSC